ncbi:MAG: hypothetical protein NT094_05125, partial [Candidatus Staskawiczbacteria bacterium]|nr:hypothetical protein [Candidatus Staskawiczbacteria bacterium]
QRTGDKSLADVEIKECVGEYNFTAKVECDTEVLSLLKNPFIIALKCTIKQGSNVLGIGRANSILSPKNRFLKNAVFYCWNAAIIDGISKTVKILNDLPLKATELSVVDKENTENPVQEITEIEYASDRQKNYLRELIRSNVFDEGKRKYWESQINQFTREEASEKIQSFVNK